MTRKEVTGIRDLTFSSWIRKKLPDSSTGFSVSDLDFILWNWKTKKVMMLEIKTRNSKPTKGQQIMWQNINQWIKRANEDLLVVEIKRHTILNFCYLNVRI